MIHGLKLGCGDLLATQLNTVNAVQTLSLARLLMMSKLQHAALQFIANDFENVSLNLYNLNEIYSTYKS